MRILIISYFFPPYNTIGAVRVGKTAKYLIRFGNDIRVITSPGQTLDNKILPPSLHLEIPEENVTYTGISSMSRLKESPEWDTKNQKRGLFKNSHLFWYPDVVKAGNNLLREWIPDIIFASALPPVSLIAAQYLAKKFRVPWVAEMRDPWADNPYIDYAPWRRSIEQRIESWTLASASGIVTVSEPLADKFSMKYQKPTTVVLNGFDPDEYSTNLGHTSSSDTVNIIYTGAVYTGKRDPSILFQALNQLGNHSKFIKVHFYGPNLEIVNNLSQKYHVDHLVAVHDTVSWKDALELQCNADILLLLLWQDPKAVGTFTGKLFEYIGARRPILTVGSPDNVAARFVNNRGIGLSSNNPSRIRDQLLEWIKQKHTDGIPAIGENIIKDLTKDKQISALEQFLFKIVLNNRQV